MSGTATLNVRMDVETKEDYQRFCDEVGVSASALMNMFAKYVTRNQRVPFALTTKTDVPANSALPDRYRRLFPASEAELDAQLEMAEKIPFDQCVSADKGFASFEERMGW